MVPKRAEPPHVEENVHDAEVHEDRRHEPPDLAVEDVVQAVVMPSAFLVAVLCREAQRRLDPCAVCRRFLQEKDDDADGDQGHGQRSPAQARVGPEVGDFAIVLAKLLVELLLAAADRLGGVDGLLIAGVVGPAQVALQLFAGACDVVFVVDPEVPALGPLVDAGLHPESQKVVGEDLGVESPWAMFRSGATVNPLEFDHGDAASRIDPASVRRRDPRDHSQTTTRGPPAHPIGPSPLSRNRAFFGRAWPADWLAATGMIR